MSKTGNEAADGPDPLWAVWRDVVAEFGLRRMIWSLMRSRTGWGLYGVDVVSTLRTMPMTVDAMALLADLPPKELLRLGELAAVNARRNEAMWRMGALFYVTIPVTLTLAGLENAPDIFKLMLAKNALMVAIGVVLMTLWLLVYFANQWRARQIEAIIDLARIERGIPRSEA